MLTLKNLYPCALFAAILLSACGGTDTSSGALLDLGNAGGDTGSTAGGGTGTTTSGSVTLISPFPNSTQAIGNQNAELVEVRWTRGGVGVAGRVTLSATNNGTFTFDPVNAGDDSVTVDTDRNGNLSRDVYFICGKATSFARVRVRVLDDSALEDEITVQCLDNPAIGTLSADKTTVAPGAKTGLPQLSFSVRSSSGVELEKQSVTFEIIRAAGNDDKITPEDAVTNTRGIAVAQFTPGTAPGTATIRACTVELDTNGNEVCADIDITIANPPPAT